MAKTTPDADHAAPNTKVAEDVESGDVVVSRTGRKLPRNYDAMHLALRLVCFLASLVSLFVMTSAKERSTMSIYGLHLPIYSKWSFSQSFDYLVGVSAVVALHSLVQLIMIVRTLLKKSSTISSRNHAWLLFAADQVFAFAMMSAGSAASGVTNVNKTGIKHSSLPDFCKPLHSFCDRVALSIAFTFFGSFLLAMSTVLDVSCVLPREDSANFKTWLRFVSRLCCVLSRRPHAFCLKTSAFCLKTKLRFVLRPPALCFKTHCVLSPEYIQCAGLDTRPPILDRTDFASWQQWIRLYCRGKENGVNILKSINEGPYQMGTFRETLAESTEGVPQFGPERPRVYSDLTSEEKDRILKSINERPYQMGTFRETLAESTEGVPQFGPERPRVYSDLTSEEKDWYNADIRATNILLQGLPKDIYTLINHYTDAKDIWDNVKMLLEGSELTKEDQKSQLYNDFEHFRQHKGESIHNYYVWFAKLINDMRNIKMAMSRLQLNFKFVNNMLPEWGRFITVVKLNRGLRDSNYDQIYAYLKQHETHAQENKMMLERFSQPTVDPLALMSNVSNPQHYSPSSSTSSSTQVPQHIADSSLSQAESSIENLTNTLALLTHSYKTFLPQTNNQLRTSSNARNQATVQDGRVDNAFDDDVDEQPVQDLALNVDNVFQADDCDAFDSDVDEAPTAKIMFMANLSSADLVTDEAGPSYDSNILSEVQDHDHYLDAVCAHYDEHVIHDSVQLNHVVDSHADYTSDSNMIMYDQYVKDNEVPFVQSDVSSIPNDAFVMIYNDMYNHTPAIVHNTENTIEIAEITRKKINDKVNDPECVTRKVKIAPHDYSKDNFLATFTPQKQLTPEQIFWSNDLIKLKSKALKEQIKVSRPIKALTVKHDVIERKTLLIANDNLVVECLSQEVFSVATNFELNVARFTEMHVANTTVEARCLALEAEIFIYVARVTMIIKRVFVIGKMQASLQGKDNVIRQLKEKLSQLQVTRSDTDRTLKVRTTYSQITKLTDHVTSLQAQNDLFRAENDKIKQHYKELYDSIKITRAKHIKQLTKLTTKNVNLKTSVSQDKVKPQVLAREKHAIDMEPIVPRLRNNRDAHLDYLRHLKESVETIRDIVEEAKVLAHIPLIRKKQVPIAESSDKSDTTTHRHVMTIKSRNPKAKNVPNKMEPNKSWGSSSNVSSSPSDCSSGLVLNLVPATPYTPPTNKELEILFQPMFDEYLKPPHVERPVLPAQAVQVSVNSAGTPSSTTIDKNAPSPKAVATAYYT
nr:CASP-like protein 3A1 [Tanacetum cinerariifolium]